MCRNVILREYFHYFGKWIENLTSKESSWDYPVIPVVLQSTVTNVE